jgi:hypothetical protein
MLRRTLPLAALLAVAAFGTSSATASASSEHLGSGEPCRGDDKSTVDEGHNGVVHCSAVWHMDPSNGPTSGHSHKFPEKYRPSDCARGTKIKGTGGSSNVDFWGPHWFFAPADGDKVTWEAQLYRFILELAPEGHDGAVNITPRFWNHHHTTWPTRYYFYCTPPNPRPSRPDPTPPDSPPDTSR